jgi:hypothetical protein
MWGVDMCEFGVDMWFVDREKFCGADIDRPEWLMPLEEWPDEPPPPPPRAKALAVRVEMDRASPQATAMELAAVRFI